MAARYRIEPFEDGAGAIGADALLAMWQAEGLALRGREGRRVHEVLLVAVHERDGLAAECSVYLQRNRRLGMDLWYLRVFTAAEHRMAGLAATLARQAHDHLERRYVEGLDRRGCGLAMEIENRGLSRRTMARWPLTGAILLGQSDRGQPFRVRYFTGAQAPGPPE